MSDLRMAESLWERAPKKILVYGLLLVFGCSFLCCLSFSHSTLLQFSQQKVFVRRVKMVCFSLSSKINFNFNLKQPNSTIIGFANPCCRITLGRTVYKTTPQRKTIDPAFHELFLLFASFLLFQKF